MMFDKNQKYQTKFFVEFGFPSDRMLQDPTTLGINKLCGTKVSVIPTTIVLKGEQKDSLSFPSDSTQDINSLIGN